MTFTQKVVVVLVIALVAIGVLYVAGRPKTVTKPATVAISTAVIASGIPVAQMVTEKNAQKDTHKSYTIEMTYPQSSATELSEVYNYVQNAKTSFLSDYNSLTDAQATQFPGEASAYDFNVTTRVATSTNTVTYIIETYQFEGGAHGGTDVNTFTYDTKGKLVTLNDVFAKPYLATVAPLAQKYFYSTLGEYAQKQMIDDGTTATTTNFSEWYLTPKTITFIFGQYQVGPYVIGIQEFPLSKSKIESLLAPQYK